MKVLLLSAYDAASHRRWREGLCEALPDYQWTVLSLPARYFNWRIRGNSLTWAFENRELLAREYDLLLATSMTDLSALRGLVPALAAVPAVVYFHENQFAYPASEQQFKSVEPQILNLYTALAADRVLFNSAFNRQSFLEGAGALLGKLPDHVPAGIIEQLAAVSEVLPVPLEASCYELIVGPVRNAVWTTQPLSTGRPLRLLWAARFEYDKGAEHLLLILRRLREQGIAFELALLGQQFRSSPKVFETIEQEFAAELVAFGYEPDLAAFQHYLTQADMVLSTALHEFQGLAVLEAVAAGCVPVLPDRQCYPAMYEARFRYPSSPQRPESEAEAAVQTIASLCDQIINQGLQAPSVESYSWACLGPAYRSVFEEVVSNGGQGKESV